MVNSRLMASHRDGHDIDLAVRPHLNACGSQRLRLIEHALPAVVERVRAEE
jgi:hypothetical protein